MNIQLGTEFSLSLKDDSSIIRACFIGEKKGKHIALAVSDEDLSCFKESKDVKDVVAQYPDGDSRYEFSSTVIQVLKDPAPIVVLSYPDKVQAVDNRSLSRINCLISAKLKNKTDNSDRTVTGVIENISKTGCLCKVEGGKVSFSLNEVVNITCPFPGLVGEQSSDGKIVRIIEDHKDTFIGIHFYTKAWWVPPYNLK